MDRVQERLRQKQDEKRAERARLSSSPGDDFDEDVFGQDEGVVIDEEELMLLREMKDLKRGYREHYDKLKQAKGSIADAQTNIDAMKQQIVFEFERWYSEEFEPNPADQMGVNHSTLLTYQGGTTEGATD